MSGALHIGSLPSLDRRRFLLGGGMLLTAVGASALVPDEKIDLLGGRKLDNVIPTRVGEWRFQTSSGLVVPPQDQLSQQLYSQLLTRVYVAPDRPPVMLLIAQAAGQTGILQVHRPETCYPVGGYTLLGREAIEMRAGSTSFPAVAFTASSAARIEQLVYWTRIGFDLPVTWVDQRLSVARANLKGQVPDAVLVRISTISANRQASMDELEKFGTALLASVSAETRRFLLGRVSG